ncbi:ubiquitin specific protease 20/33 isoform X2 [Lycorma delicatula]|uniref:ubiquitin specific protease 20/33 isoform X2 n=1 Tax=Lycorma delicatula TaxID=130591 RepID=UPI003F512A92
MAASPGRAVHCPHITASTSLISQNDLDSARESAECYYCEDVKGDVWLCLNKDCLTSVCKDFINDHRLLHYQEYTDHYVYISVISLRIWCYQCKGEMILIPPAQHVDLHQPTMTCRLRHLDYIDNDDSDDSRSTIMDDNTKPTGLTGLQNIGNTCYMNAALQALSNTPPLTEFFLGCGISAISSTTSGSGTGDGNKKPLTLSKSYHRLMQELWDRKRRGYVAPTGILYGIRNAHPMFRGYHQHDTQEFLRCFMDLLHEELKVPLVDPPTLPKHERMSGLDEDLSDGEMEGEQNTGSSVVVMGGEGEVGGGASSQSEGDEYETCDSGVSERSSLSEEGSSTKGSTKRNRSLSRSPSPPPERLRSKLTSTTKGQHHGSSPRGSHRSRKQVKFRSIISDVFDGKLLSSVQCLTCNRISTRVETFQDLSLPIPSRDHLNMLHQGSVNSTLAKCTELYSTDQGWLNWLWEWLCSWFWGPTVSLHDCLAAFFSADELKGDNMYSCEKCNKLRNGVKYSKVLELPEVLCIHLKRFRHELMFSSKINSHVTFPLEGLELKPYLHKDCVSQVTSYDLVSVICHHGAAGSGGHYTCYSLNAQSEQWYEFDDQCVTRVSPDIVRTCEAYVLFYRKNGSAVNQLRHRALHLVELTGDVPGPRYIVSKQWVNRFNTFAEPGPINNTDFLCHHNQILPGRESTLHHLTTTLPAPVWDYLYEKFGGGPVCSLDKLQLCDLCSNNMTESNPISRQESEMREFSRLEQEIMSSNGQQVQMNAVSLQWFISWNSYVKGWSNDPPGPIDNSHLATCSSDGSVMQVKDYRQVSKDQWEFFHRIYGGGPEVQFRLLNGQPLLIVSTPSQPIPNNKTTYTNRSAESCCDQQSGSNSEQAGDSLSSGHWSNNGSPTMKAKSAQIGDCSNCTPAMEVHHHTLMSAGDHSTPLPECKSDSDYLLSLLDVRIETSSDVNHSTTEIC